MRLKRVRVFGFKTFADRTEFSLEGGLVAVVGPNGCGKSNLVDAILWGLGEGNARQLRAQTGQDVIFSGSARRKPVGFAEVTLLFDNEDGALPVDTREVAISRRINRAGDSEYAINRQTCRLRDIYELLADSGLGRAGYAIVGQKEIDGALSASAEDRRAWVDEAAGVQRYRARKVESQRRLETARDHLRRVDDVLRELEAQRDPLREEAEVARRYRQIAAALRDLERGLLVREVAESVEALADAERRIESAAETAAREVARAETLEREGTATGQALSELASEMELIRTLQQSYLTALERAHAGIQLADQRLVGLDELERTLADAGDEDRRAQEAEQELAAADAEVEAERTSLSALEATLAEQSAAGRQLSEALREAEQALETARRHEAERNRRAAAAAQREERRVLVDRELEGIARTKPELETAVAEATAALEDERAKVAAAKAARGELTQRRDALRAEEEADAQGQRRLLAERAQIEGRRRGIEATLDAHEGVSQGARAVLEAAERGLLSGRYVPVGDAVRADKEVALAIETALGAAANDLIVDDERDAKAAIEWLKANRAGRATFQPIPLMRPSEPTSDLRRMLTERGVLGRANTLVDAEARFRPVVDSLLGRVVIVEDLDVALRLARTGGWSRLVTLAGEVVHSGGAVTGGQASRASFGLVQRRAELGEIEAELEALERKLAGFEKRAKARADERARLEAQVNGQRAEMADLEHEVEERHAFRQSLLEELRAAQREEERLLRERASLEAADAESLPPVDLVAAEATRDAAMAALASGNAEAAQAETRRREAHARVEQALARRDAVARRLAAAREAMDARAKRQSRIEPERAKVREDRARFEREQADAEAGRDDAARRLEAAQQRQRSLMEQGLRLAEEARAARQNAQTIGEAATQAEIHRARADARRATAAQRLAEEYGLTEEEALGEAPSVEIPEDAPGTAARLRRDLRAMGEVNLGAIEAFDRVNARVAELGAQRDDILGGIAEVERSIDELDRLTRDRFLTTFDQLEAEFAANFQRLFGGGEGQLILTDRERVLESGIDLRITLPGKRQQPLNLLSGGERALAALAFLFALLKVKPAPLVVLDEVDAPLDGRNVERFADLLRDFSARVQFIVITHNMVTIASAPIWLGVTMQEPGVSSLVPVRLPESKEAMETAAAIAPIRAGEPGGS